MNGSKLLQSSLPFVLTLALGCARGPAPASVHGSVRYDGVSVADGTIQFEPIQGTAGDPVLTPFQDGEFETDGLVADGEYLVRIQGFRIESVPDRRDPKRRQGISTRQFLPIIYNEKSTLTRTLKGSSTRLDFDLPRGEEPEAKKPEKFDREHHDDAE